MRQALPRVCLIVGTATAAGTALQLLLQHNPSNLLVAHLVCHLALLSASLYWLFRHPPVRAYPAALAVLCYLSASTGAIFFLTEQPSHLIFMGLLSVAAFFFLVDRRYLVASQAFGFACMLPGIAITWDSPDFISSAMICVAAWSSGVALHVGRLSIMYDLDRIQRDLNTQTEQRQRFEEQSLLAHKRESLGAMVGGVAHDFNNLLLGILNGVELAEESGQDNARRQKALTLVRQSSDAARDLCLTLLDYAGGAAPELTPLDVAEVIADAVNLCQQDNNNPVAIEAKLQSAHVLGHRSQIRQAIINLVTNANQAVTGSNGKILVECQVVDRDGQPWARITVTDNGGGIPEHVRGRLFDPFFTTKRDGRGLGLAAVAQAVSVHGGEICVDSQPGATCFEIHLPIAGPASASSVSELPRSDPKPSQTDSGIYPTLSHQGTPSPRSLGAILAEAFDDLPYLIYYKDTNNRHLRVNRAVAKLHNQAPETLENTSAEQLYPENASRFYADDLEVIRTGKPKLGILEQITIRPGLNPWFRTDKLPTFGADGKVDGILVFAQRIADRNTPPAEPDMAQTARKTEAR